MRLAGLLTLLALACGPSSSPSPAEPAPAPVEPSTEAAAPSEAEPDVETEPEDALPDAPPSFDEATLDDMDERALEAACMQGSTTACDRLGH